MKNNLEVNNLKNVTKTPRFDYRILGTLLLCGITTFSNIGCAGDKAQAQKVAATPPAKVENAPKENELSTITLTPEAESRLKINVETVVSQAVRSTREYSGEVVLPPDSTYTVTAPITGTLIAVGSPPASGTTIRKAQTVYKILPIVTSSERDQRELLERDTNIAATAADNDIEAAKTRVDAAKIRLARAEQLVKDGGGSQKAAEITREELRIAEITLKAARQRFEETKKVPPPTNEPVDVKSPQNAVIQKLHVTAGQTVASGTVLFEAATFQSVLVRVPVYVGELNTVEQRAAARIHTLNDVGGKGGRYAQPTNAPPSADANAATVDLYFILQNDGNSLRPGQRVGATLSVKTDSGDSLVIPQASILHDVSGGTWVYEQIAPLKYARRRVVVNRVADDIAILDNGPPAGTKIVTAGASELFGTEFSTGK
ncbi:MAG: efflux RND transporter periplasmic adaptor subunit [Pyrinomonadaceae bacterium]|nr:efflux RND transporter periplasmic adaptor subunit [Pyrinomonadaceae bacterium]